MDEAAIELTQTVIELEKCDERVRSLFQLTVLSSVPYSYGWRLLRRAVEMGLLNVERTAAPPFPLEIASTEHGRSVVAQRACGRAPKWQEARI